MAEIFGSLIQLVTSTDDLYRAHLATVMSGMGFTPQALTRVTPPVRAA